MPTPESTPTPRPAPDSEPADSFQADLVHATAWLIGIIVLVTCVLPLCGFGFFLWLFGSSTADAGPPPTGHSITSARV